MTVDIATSTIVAQAFDFMEKAEISSFGDESSEAAKAAQVYPRARDMVLEHYDWSAARTFASLPEATAVAQDPDLPVGYVLPTDCLILRSVRSRDVWRQDGRFIRAMQAGGLDILYTRRIEVEAELPAFLQTAIASQMAVLLSPKFVGSRTKRADLRVELNDLLMAAKRHDSHSASGHAIDAAMPDGDWVCEARL
ncbi:hypothetical protein [Palleronia pelagia]|uniref:Uncharacterized protein n=1 Tax=Palleronia pelagia TaxID=387096 RepID=A0A1H8HVH3_9RHOB|nr:hypothetical protein [Palleronia pelagia]SEN60193.1 hypothetical protein SAMN04488011_10519 [Palleronia pelagia]